MNSTWELYQIFVLPIPNITLRLSRSFRSTLLIIRFNFKFCNRFGLNNVYMLISQKKITTRAIKVACHTKTYTLSKIYCSKMTIIINHRRQAIKYQYKCVCFTHKTKRNHNKQYSVIDFRTVSFIHFRTLSIKFCQFIVRFWKRRRHNSIVWL